MRKLVLTVLTVLLLSQVAFAANYSFTSTAAQEALISLARADYNEAKKTSFTNLQYIRFVLRDKLGEWEAKFDEVSNESRRDAYRDADQSTKDEINTLLGL